jgi:ABC-2 type transport system permease protein
MNRAAQAVCGVPLWRVLLLEARMEFLRLLRNPGFSVPIISFPLLFYVLFAIMLGPRPANVTLARHMLANFTVFSAMAPGLFGLGVTLALDRERGLLELKRALPVPPAAYLGAKLLMSVAFAAIVSLLLMLLAATLGEVALGAIQWCTLLALALLGVVPFCALGLWVGTLVKGQAAPAVINLLYLPMGLLSGVLLPLSILPAAVARCAPLWPSYHLAQLALYAVDREQPPQIALHIGALCAAAAVFFGAALRRLRTLR